MGTVSAIHELDKSESGGGGWSMVIADSSQILDDCHIGDSISVNGCCLTVTEFDVDSFKLGLAPETLSRTNLGET
jgi:riboflavin synthase